MTLGLELQAGKVVVFAIDVSQGLRCADASILQTLHQVDDIGGVHTARACAAREQVIGVLAKEGDGLDLSVFPRQTRCLYIVRCTGCILQQHNTLASRLACDGSMCLKVRLIGGRIVLETGCLDNILQHAAHVTVDILHRQSATIHAIDNLLHLCWLSWFHQVVACLHLSDGLESLADANPVGHHDALIAPVVAQDAGEQVAIAHRVLAVDHVIARHDGPGLTLANGNLEATQIELASSTLTELLVNAGAVGLLRVDSEVLGRHASTLTLHAVDIGSANLTCEQRVF